MALLNPGLRSTDTFDALIVVRTGPVDEKDLKRSARSLLQAAVPGITADLREQALQVTRGRARARDLSLGDVEAAEITLTGAAGDGRAVHAWIAMTRDARDSALVLVVALQGREDTYLASARQMLASLRFEAAPQEASTKPQASAAALLGLEFGHTTFGSDSSLTTVYRFTAEGVVTRRTMFSSPFGGSDSEVRGSFTVLGEDVTLRLDGEVVRAKLERRENQVTGLKLGNATYRPL
ncbi:MAG: hypothetical protein R3F49_18405 [Planctomycetota bacterium]